MGWVVVIVVLVAALVLVCVAGPELGLAYAAMLACVAAYGLCDLARPLYPGWPGETFWGNVRRMFPSLLGS